MLLFPPEFTEWQVLGCLELHGEILPQKLFSYTREKITSYLVTIFLIIHLFFLNYF